jgi:alkylation response protein AidB-like acyl-CoA dehydrogenase
MNLTLSSEQRMLVEAARGFLRRSCPPEHVRAMENDPRGFSPELWREIASLGWPGIAVPVEYGGAGRTFLDFALLLEELGRVLLPSPMLASAVVATDLLLTLASGDQKAVWLADLAAGRKLVTLALAEPGWRDEWGAVSLQARASGEFLALSGTKLFVPFAPSVDCLLVAVRLEGGTLALVAIEPGTAGVSCTRLETLDGGHPYEVTFTGALVPRSSMIGTPQAVASAIERSRYRAAVASMAFMTGAAERVLEMTIEHARTRTQFGRPIGSFQAVAHRCVDMRSDIDALRYLVYQAAWSLSEGRAADLEAGAAKAYGNEALRRILLHAHQVHGAIGFSTEYDLQLFTRRAKAAELEWGSASNHRERVARAMGL